MDDRVVKKQRLAVLIYLYVLAILWGTLIGSSIELVRTEHGTHVVERFSIIVSLATQLGFMWFCTVDAKLVGRSLMKLAKVGIFFGWPIGVPIYLLWARGLRGLVTLLLHGLLLLLCIFCAGLVAGYLWYTPGT